MADYLMPEDYGAVGDGVTDDAAAFASLLAAADSSGKPILCKPTSVYALGSTSWVGLSLTLSRDLHIDMNGASLLFLVAPSQNSVIGAGPSVFNFDGTSAKYRLSIQRATIDFNGLLVYCFSPYRCDLNIFRCDFRNGDMSNSGIGSASVAIFANACSGSIRENYSKNVGYLVFMGHTDAGYFSDGLRVIGNRGEDFFNPNTPTYRGDFCVGVVKNAVIADNVASGVYGGAALAGYGTTGMVSENVQVIGNTFSDCTGQGIQTDIVSNFPNTQIQARNIAIIGNTIRQAGAGGAGIYAIKIANFSVVGNVIDACELGIVVDNAANGVVSGNTIDGDGAETKYVGINVNDSLGASSGIAIGPNQVSNYVGENSVGLNLPGTVDSVAITGGNYDNNTVGVRIIDGTDLVVSGVSAHGNTYDFLVRPLDCVVEAVSYETQAEMQYRDLPNLDTTPAVGGRKVYRLNNSGATSITSFDDGADGQEIILYAANGNTTINHGGSIVNVGAVNHTLAANGMIAYRRFNATWFEQWRNF